jgi:hypothetical protein
MRNEADLMGASNASPGSEAISCEGPGDSCHQWGPGAKPWRRGPGGVRTPSGGVWGEEPQNAKTKPLDLTQTQPAEPATFPPCTPPKTKTTTPDQQTPTIQLDSPSRIDKPS